MKACVKITRANTSFHIIPCISWGWEGPRGGLDVLEKRELSSPLLDAGT